MSKLFEKELTGEHKRISLDYFNNRQGKRYQVRTVYDRATKKKRLFIKWLS